ncbi:MAG: DUF938 domain-containing protein [Myxococcales bacterium FL481]|nr:MAG: DUF938 domain-containing protein [Myxococcales bacterium FL481]
MSAKLYYPATSRNREPLLEAVHEVFAASTRVLEVASGSGEHLEFIAPHFPNCHFVPSDIEPKCLDSVAERARECPSNNIATPVRLDASDGPWPNGPFDAVFNANMIHIAPWAACQGLLAGAAQCLRPGGYLCLYGPFMRSGSHTAPSNAAFSEDLQRRDSRWGVRDLDEVERAAVPHGLELAWVKPMPANNFTVAFRRD